MSLEANMVEEPTVFDAPTFRLYARPSFLKGVARLLDFGNGLNSYNVSRSSEEASGRAFRSDWQAIGGDFRRAITSIAPRLHGLAK